MSSVEQFVEIRVRHQSNPRDNNPERRTAAISCTGSFSCVEFYAPDLLTADKALGMCAVKNGSIVEIDGIHYSSGPLSPDHVPQAVKAAFNCDSEAVLIVDRDGVVHGPNNDEAILELLPNDF